MRKITLETTSVRALIVLRDTPTADALWSALPFESRASTWGEEVYFRVPFTAGLEDDAQQVVAPGTLGYWVEGQSLALPFGPTPISRGDECRLAARVNLVGMLEGDPRVLGGIGPGEQIKLGAA